MRVKGVVYTIPVCQAKELEWRLLSPTPGDGNDQFVLVEPVYNDVHAFLEMADLGTELEDVPVEGYDKPTMQRILAKAKTDAVSFAKDWEAKQWSAGKTHVGEIANSMVAIEDEDGWPTGNTGLVARKKNAYRLEAFIFNLRRSAGKEFKEAACIGSPVDPNQLHAAAQLMLSAKEGSDWECPIATPTIECI